VTSIVVSKRDGIAKAPDGTKYRVARGKTLADARHPVVEAYPNDWVPMVVDLSVEDGERAHSAVDEAALEELRSDLAEAEELAEHRGAELLRLAQGIEGLGYELPADADRYPGWLTDLVLGALPVRPPVVAELPVDAPAPHSATAECEVEVTPAPAAPRITPPRTPRKARPHA